MKYWCTVCGYDGLADPPADHNICPCCGTEFGYHDLVVSWEELRHRWIVEGAKWFSDYTHPCADWNPVGQLVKLSAQKVSASQTVQLIELRNVAGPPIVTDAPIGRTDSTTDRLALTA